jgi:hypothetical protein
VSRIGGIYAYTCDRDDPWQSVSQKRLALLILLASLFNHVLELSALHVCSNLSIFLGRRLDPSNLIMY